MTAAAKDRVAIRAGHGPTAVQDWLTRVVAPHGEVLETRTRSWQSVTFSGFRFEAALRWRGLEACIDGEAFVELLREAELAARGLMLADAAIVWTRRIPKPMELAAGIELLVLETE